MKILSRILGYSWKYFVFTVIVFVLFWHLLSVRSAVRTAEDKFDTALEQNVVDLEASFLNNNAVEFQNILWQIKNDGIVNMVFFPSGKRPGSWMFKEVVVGELLNRTAGVLRKSAMVISNGAELGRLEYSIDLVYINASVFRQNHLLFITVVFFFLGLLVISNLGAIQTLLAIERSVNEINAITAAGRGDMIRDLIKKNISRLPAGIIGTPFAQMTGRMSDALSQAARLEGELAVSKAVSDLAAQVAHDIRSPLAALGSAAKDLALPEEQRKLMEGAVGRMQGIADDLLQRYRAPSAAAVRSKPVVCALGGLIEQVLAEKRLQHKEKPGVKIEFTEASDEIKALVEPKELQRLISNLVNNSVEAFDGPGTVFVALSAADGRVLIEVKDNGKGIPPEILAKLGRKGETHGKAGGNGLGLYHARTTVEGWGGSFTMKSEPGQGTTVLITLPRTAALPAGSTAVLLDDDPLVHMNWKLAAKAAGVELKAYKTPEEFIPGIEALPKDTPIYIDSDLGNGVKGENIATNLHTKGFTDLTMATGHGPEEFAPLPWLKVTGKEPPWGE